VVTYTGNGTAGATIGHGLGVAPNIIIVKSRSSAVNWVVYTSVMGNTGSLYLNLTNSFTTVATWNNTTPTSSVFSVNGAGYYVNDSGATYVAYCFSAVAGYSAFGKYTGNLSTNGPFVYTGFRPRFLMIKNVTYGQPWIMIDTARNPYNVGGDYLQADSSSAQNSGSAVSTATALDILSNGFKIRNDASSSGYTNNGDCFYMAFAENPFKYSRAR